MTPSGTVVFLFSDIEGSTARWETQPQAMQAVLRRHDQLLRAAMEARNGYVFKTIGDAFCVAFSDAHEALEAALQSQRELNWHDWSSVEGLRVRMALHAGESDERGGDYFGPTVNRVARLLSAAHGGQVVVSGVVADMLGKQLPEGASLRALGSHRLKDLQSPERVYQLIAADLPSDFKPLRSLAAVPNNLPLQATGLVGRDADVSKIRDLLRESTLVTITGAGGVGKTRVALQCAAEIIDRAPDGAWFVNLAPIADASLVASTVLSALGTSADHADALESITSYLKHRELVIVLDNCEHVLNEAARVVAAIRERCPHVTIIATSREVLHVDGERVYRLPPLADADSMQLFVQRARGSVPSFEVSDPNGSTLEAICRHLDGIPLAIELAAARVRVLSLDELLKRLSERFRVLTGGVRTALPRQQTLQALIDWSFELLTDDEKTLFRRVSIFSGSFTLDAASTICCDDQLDEWAILDLLTSLVDKSLVVADVEETQQRYHLLETIHDYARRKLAESGAEDLDAQKRFRLLSAIREYAQSRAHEAGETLWLGERHALFFAERASKAFEEFDGRPEPDWLERLKPDLDNYRAALHWTLEDSRDPSLGAQLAGNIAPMFLRMSLLDEGIAWCKRAAVVQDLVPSSAGRVHYTLSMLYNNRLLVSNALNAAENATTLYEQSNDSRGLIRAKSQVAQLQARQGHFDKARPIVDAAITGAQQLEDPYLLASVIRRCAFALPSSEIELARQYFESAVSALRARSDLSEACNVLQWWAETEARAGCFERAVTLAKEALEHSAADARMYLTNTIVSHLLANRDFDGASTFATISLGLAMQAGHVPLTTLGVAFAVPDFARDDSHDAARFFGYACARLSEINWFDSEDPGAAAIENVRSQLREQLKPDEITRLFAEGAAWTEDQFLARVRSRLNSVQVRPSAAVQRS